MLFLYMFIVLLATTIGSLAGLGGGVIIKPLLDAIAYHDIQTITTLSSVAVFFMSITSLIKKRDKVKEVSIKLLMPLSFGSIVGGILGNQAFSLLNQFYMEASIQRLQTSILFIMMLLIFAYTLYQDKCKVYQVTNPAILGLIGFVLGLLAALLGVGGGPLNVMILMMFLGMGIKDAALSSIFVIFFAQLSNIIMSLFAGKLNDFPYEYLFIIIISGISGGMIGSKLSFLFTEDKTKRLYQGILVSLILLNLINLIT